MVPSAVPDRVIAEIRSRELAVYVTADRRRPVLVYHAPRFGLVRGRNRSGGAHAHFRFVVLRGSKGAPRRGDPRAETTRIAMEDMTAGSLAPLAKVLEMVDRSEAYVGIFAWR
jgi:hypothetical protein